ETTEQSEVFNPMQLKGKKSTSSKLVEDFKSPPMSSANDTITSKAPKPAITPIIRPRSVLYSHLITN
ncbi:hypothetical protein H0H87_012505, partial [Tephrocybe sp. NHM501043]